MNKKIFIACDTNKISTVKKIIDSTRTNKAKYWLQIWLRILELKKWQIFYIQNLIIKLFLQT